MLYIEHARFRTGDALRSQEHTRRLDESVANHMLKTDLVDSPRQFPLVTTIMLSCKPIRTFRGLSHQETG